MELVSRFLISSSAASRCRLVWRTRPWPRARRARATRLAAQSNDRRDRQDDQADADRLRQPHPLRQRLKVAGIAKGGGRSFGDRASQRQRERGHAHLARRYQVLRAGSRLLDVIAHRNRTDAQLRRLRIVGCQAVAHAVGDAVGRTHLALHLDAEELETLERQPFGREVVRQDVDLGGATHFDHVSDRIPHPDRRSVDGCADLHWRRRGRSLRRQRGRSLGGGAGGRVCASVPAVNAQASNNASRNTFMRFSSARRARAAAP